MKGALFVGGYLKNGFKILNAIFSQEPSCHCRTVALVIATGIAHINQVIGVELGMQHDFKQSALIRIKNGGHAQYGCRLAFAIQYQQTAAFFGN